MNKEQNTENKDLTATFGNTMLCSRCDLLTRNLNRSTEVVFIFFCVVAKINLKN